MARQSKLNEKQKEDVMNWFAEGNPAHQIIKLLKQKYNHVVSHATISKYLKNVKEQRQAATDMAYKQAVANSANRDIDIIDNKINQLNKIATDLLDNKDYKLGRDMSDILLKFISKKIDLNITNEPEEKTNNLLNSLLDKIENK